MLKVCFFTVGKINGEDHEETLAKSAVMMGRAYEFVRDFRRGGKEAESEVPYP
jgi:hypothetical protein